MPTPKIEFLGLWMERSAARRARLDAELAERLREDRESSWRTASMDADPKDLLLGGVAGEGTCAMPRGSTPRGVLRALAVPSATSASIC